MKNAAYFRKEAAKKCTPYSNALALIYFIEFIITSVCGALSALGVGTIVSLLISGPIACSFAAIAVKVDRSEQVKPANLFDGFQYFSSAFLIGLLQAIFIVLWALLLIIPGIIKAFSYSMAYYVFLENPNMKASDCIKASKELMKGHKWRLFCLEFSYIGWLILCALTLGILSFWVAPKMEQAKYEFYKDVSAKVSEEGLKEGLEEVSEETSKEASEEVFTEC